MSSFKLALSVMACLAMMAQHSNAMVVNPHVLPSFSQILAGNAASPATPAHPAGQFEGKMAFGAAAVFFMLLCKLHERNSRAFAIGTIVFGLMASSYGFLQGAWPLGIAMSVYSIASLRSFVKPRARHPKRVVPRAVVQAWQQSRVERLFGPMSEV